MKRSLSAVGNLSGSWITLTREERSLLDPTLRFPRFQAKVWAWDRGIWCERPTMALALRLGPGRISAAAGGCG